MDGHKDETAREIAAKLPSGHGPRMVPPENEPMLLDESAFEKLRRDYGARLVDSVVGWVRDREKAEDITAKTFQAAWEHREDFKGRSSPSTWLEAIARNEVRQHWNRNRNVRFDSIDGGHARGLAVPDRVFDDLEKREDRLRLHEALAQLPSKQRRALTAHFLDGLSIRDIAERDHVPYGTVLSRIANAKERLREAWDAQPVVQTFRARAGAESPDRGRAR